MQHECEIIPFPLDRQLFRIRQTARILEVRQGAAAERFWRQEVRRLEAELIVQRLPKDVIDTELRAFAAAVQFELQAAARARQADYSLDGDAA
jgi:hypothetical protein